MLVQGIVRGTVGDTLGVCMVFARSCRNQWHLPAAQAQLSALFSPSRILQGFAVIDAAGILNFKFFVKLNQSQIMQKFHDFCVDILR